MFDGLLHHLFGYANTNTSTPDWDWTVAKQHKHAPAHWRFMCALSVYIPVNVDCACAAGKAGVCSRFSSVCDPMGDRLTVLNVISGQKHQYSDTCMVRSQCPGEMLCSKVIICTL